MMQSSHALGEGMKLVNTHVLYDVIFGHALGSFIIEVSQAVILGINVGESAMGF